MTTYRADLQQVQGAVAQARQLADTRDQRAALDQFDKFWSGQDGYLAGNEDAFAKKDAGNAAAAQAAYVSVPFVPSLDAAQKYIDVVQREIASSTHTMETEKTIVQDLDLGLGVLALVIGAAVAFLLSGSIGRRVRQAAAAARGLAEGDLDQRVDLNSTDEIGDLARAFAAMIAYQRRMADTARALAGGDLSRDVQPAGERDELGNAFAGMVSGLRELVRGMQAAAADLAAASSQLGSAAEQTGGAVQQVTAAVQGIAAGAQETSRSALNSSEAVQQLVQAIDGIARGAAEQAQQAQTASSSTLQMAERVQAVAGKAQSVAETSSQARQAAEHGAQAVTETVRGMGQITLVVTEAAGKVEDLGRLGDKIGAVVETIDDIAEQTNLLALNAAIEAARAGEHGRGFAVVADEVRKLAERSQRETKAIAGLIEQVQAGTREAVSAIQAGTKRVDEGAERADQAGRALAEIQQAVESTVAQVLEIAGAAAEMQAGAQSMVEAMTAISAVVEENSAATEEMAAQSEQVSGAIGRISAVAEENSATTEEVSASAEEMTAQVTEMGEQARTLAATAAELKALVDRFQLEQIISEPEPQADTAPIEPLAA